MELHYWWDNCNEKNKIKLVEWKAFVDTIGIKSVNLKEKIFL